MLFNRLSQVSIRVAEDSESIVTMSPQDDMHFEVEFDLDHLYAPSEKIF
jgi:hypothetical protein